MHWIIGIASLALTFISAWLMPILYEYWKKMPNPLQYLLFLPTAFLSGTFLASIISLAFFRDLGGLWIEYVFPIFRTTIQVLMYSIIIVFLVPKNEEVILKSCLAILLMGLNIVPWVLLSMYSNIILDHEFFCSLFTIFVAAIAFWKAKSFVNLKKKYENEYE